MILTHNLACNVCSTMQTLQADHHALPTAVAQQLFEFVAAAALSCLTILALAVLVTPATASQLRSVAVAAAV
jgi:hypothetical protein